MFKKLNFLITFLLSAFLSLTTYAQTNKLSLIFAANMPDISTTDTLSYAKLASLLELARQDEQYNVFVFGGGSLGPSPLSSLDRGSHIIDILNTLEPDLMTLSKREFSYNEDELTLRSYEAAFPFVSANLFDPLTTGNLEGVESNILIDKGGLQIGFISILDEEVVEEYLLQRANVEEPRAIIERQIKQLKRKGANIIVMMYSKQKEYYQQLLETNDIAFALRLSSTSDEQNNNHSLLKTFTVTDKHPVVSLNLTWLDAAPNDIAVEENTIDTFSLSDDRKTVLMIDEYKQRLHRLLNQSIGRTRLPMHTQRQLVRTQETAFGNLVTDALKDATNSDVAIINGGVIRGDKSYSAETPITRGDIIRELPFRSHVATGIITGQQLLLALENGVSEVELAKGRFPQIAGIHFTYSMKKPAGSRIEEILINGEALQATKQYTLVTSDYLIKGGDGYTTLSMTQSKSITTQDTPLISDVVVRAIQNQQNISPKIEGRIVRLDK